MRIIDLCIEEGVDASLIAGDLYDGDQTSMKTARFFRRSSPPRRRGVSTFILRGNHDAESVVTKSLIWPERVFEFPTRRPGTFRLDDLDVALHGRSFPHREVSENYALDYPDPVVGKFNIGVLHTACGHAGHANYAPCTPADLTSRGYNYWALGHVHAFEIVSRDP